MDLMKDLVDLKAKGKVSPQISLACFKPEQLDILENGIFLIKFRGVAVWEVGVLSQHCLGPPLPSIHLGTLFAVKDFTLTSHAKLTHTTYSSLESIHKTSSALQPECSNQPVPSPAFSRCFFSPHTGSTAPAVIPSKQYLQGGNKPCT